MAEDIPAVDAAEVEALARAADVPRGPIGRPLTKADIEHLRQNEGAGLEGAGEGMRSGISPGSRPAAQEDALSRPASPEPKGALETLVEQAVAKEFGGLRSDLADLKRWLRHTMHLCMVLANRLAVHPDELNEAAGKVTAADQAIRKEQP